jgi:hypothetical protein
MVKFRWPGRAWVLVAALGCAAGGHPTTAPTSQPTTQTATNSFQDAAGLIRLEYPMVFKTQHDPDYVLSATSDGQTLTLDIPDLPPHIPNMIPLGLVVNGYKNDLKKSHPGIKIEEEKPPAVPQAVARELRSSWTEKGDATVELTLLMVHGDHVFILRVVTLGAKLDAARAVFDRIVAAMQFLK